MAIGALSAISALSHNAPVAAHAAGGGLNTTGVVTWGVQNIIPLLLLVIGINIIAGARKGKLSENAATLTNVLIGAGVIASAAFIFAFATNITQLIFGG